MSVRPRAVLRPIAPTLLTAALLCAVAAPSEAATPQIYGRVTDVSTHQAVGRIKVLMFDANWNYLMTVNTGSNGVYTITAPAPGSYHLQLVDRRPAYDVKAYARKLDVRVTVGSTSVRKNVAMRRGGSIGGTIMVSHHRGSGATVRAVSDSGQVYEVQADSHGRYALGGLGVDNYRVFAYDARKNWVGSSASVTHVASRSYRELKFVLRTRAASYQGFLTTGGSPAKGQVTVTAVNQRTGEYWVQNIKGGDLSLRGLTAGTYRLQVPDTNGYFGKTFTLGGVKAGQTSEANVDLPIRGGTFVGTVVDDTTGAPIKNASVRLVDADGKTQSEVTTSATGAFEIGGTLHAQTGVTITIFTYAAIDGHTYVAREYTAQPIADDAIVDLHETRLVRAAVQPPAL